MSMKKSTNWTPIVLLALVIVVAVIYIFPTKTTFAGSHTVQRIENSSSYGYPEFCLQCHEDIVNNITYSTAHSTAGCICHGYSPNLTASNRNIRLEHNLTKNVYCTNCHTGYNMTGDLYVAGGGTEVNVQNQSAHYIFFNRSNSSSVDAVYNRSWRYFNKSFGPLE